MMGHLKLSEPRGLGGMSQGENHSTTQSPLGILEEIVSKCLPFKKKRKKGRDTLVFVGTSLRLFEERLPPY
jgi:hypothetical protein